MENLIKIVKIIDNYIYKKGGWLYKIWFVFEGSGRFDEDSGSEMGYVKHNIKFLDKLYKERRKKMKNKTDISFSNLIKTDVGSYDNNTYSFNEFSQIASELLFEHLEENKDPILELPEVKECPYIVNEALYDYEQNAYANFSKELISLANNMIRPIIEPVFTKWGIKIGDFKYNSPREYNFRTDELDLEVKGYLTEEKFKEMKEELRPEIEKYIDEVRQKSYDGYMSFEPDNFDEVKADDYAYLWAILEKENLIEDIRDIFEDDIRETLSEWLTYELYGEYIAGLQKGVVAELWNDKTEKRDIKIELKLTPVERS